MILNKKQLSIAQKAVETLREKIRPLSASNDLNDIRQVYAWKCRIEDLTADIVEFQFLKNTSTIEFAKEDLLKAVICLRVASGMTQKELADAIMVQEQQIQRYEQDYYRTASFERIVQILQELSKDIRLRIELNKAKPISFFPRMYEQYPNIWQMKKAMEGRRMLMAS